MENLEQNVIRRAIVVPPNPEDEVLNEVLGFDEYGKEERHTGPIGRFMKEHGLEIDGFKHPPAYVMSKYLAHMGYLVFNIDETNTAYMPEVITERQREWCLANLDIIKSEKFAILSLESGVYMGYDEFSSPNEDLFLKFLALLDKKFLNENNKLRGR